MIDSLSSLSLASLHSGDFPIQSRWRSRPGQLAQATRPNIRVYGACTVCRCVATSWTLIMVHGEQLL
jgi:hypothetical protein